MNDNRLIRVPLPASIVRDIDNIVEARASGYRSREEFIRDAVEAMVLEVRYGGQAASAPEPDDSRAAPASRPEGARPGPASPRQLHDATLLGPCPSGATITNGVADVAEAPLFGLHNRDYPSLWAARRLADMIPVTPVPAREYLMRVAEQAWEYGDFLASLPQPEGRKLTALFPTNRSKPESAEEAFLTFGVGSIRTHGDRIVVDGPVFAWRLAQLERAEDPVIALTPEGRQLLDDLAELSLDPPGAQLAGRFLHHLERHARPDFDALLATLRFIAEGADRRTLIQKTAAARPEWTETVAATNAAGYLARGREWGLVGVRRARGPYMLTDFGHEFLNEHDGGGT